MYMLKAGVLSKDECMLHQLFGTYIEVSFEA